MVMHLASPNPNHAFFPSKLYFTAGAGKSQLLSFNEFNSSTSRPKINFDFKTHQTVQVSSDELLSFCTEPFMKVIRHTNKEDGTWKSKKICGASKSENCRHNFAVAKFKGNVVYLSGGRGKTSTYWSSWKATTSVKRFNLRSEEWAEIAPLNVARYHHSSCFLE